MGISYYEYSICSISVLHCALILENVRTIAAEKRDSSTRRQSIAYLNDPGDMGFVPEQFLGSNFTEEVKDVSSFADVAISPVAPYLLPTMLAIFIIMTNLILFNLMIAMFKYSSVISSNIYCTVL